MNKVYFSPNCPKKGNCANNNSFKCKWCIHRQAVLEDHYEPKSQITKPNHT